MTGGAGFIGSHFVRYLLKHRSEYRVVVLDNLTYAGRKENLHDVMDDIEFLRGDICSESDVEQAMRGCQLVFNFAAESHVDRSIRYAGSFVDTNVRGTHVLLEAARRHGTDLFVQISTDEVYGSRLEGSFTEEDPLDPSSPYSASKASSDLLVLSYFKTYALPVVVTRSTNNFGPYQYPEKLIPLFILTALDRKPLPVYGDGRYVRDWIYVEDNCVAVDLVSQKGTPGETYNIGAKNERQNLEVADLIQRFTDRTEDLIRFVEDRPGHDRRYSLDIGKLEQLGWHSEAQFEDRLKSTVEWYQTHESWWRPILEPNDMAGSVMPISGEIAHPAGPLSSYTSHKKEIDDAISRVLSGGRYVLGDEVVAFEEEFADYVGVRFGIGVGSGTEALHVSLLACGVGPGDDVITVAFTAGATVAAIELCGATPVFVDVDPESFTIDSKKLEAAITSKSKAVVPVHLYGHPADMDAVASIAREHGLYVIEDCAQSHGASFKGRQTGSLGDMGAFSFYPTKNLGALGDGGMVVCDDSTLADRARMQRQYGWRERDISEFAGLNTRLDELQAAVLRVKLGHLEEDNSRRRKLASLYSELLSSAQLELPKEGRYVRHVYHQYVVRSQTRDALKAYLRERGVETQIHYPVPVHLQPAYQGRLGRNDTLLATEQLCREILSLPLHPHITEQYVRSVCEFILAAPSTAPAK